MSDEGSKSNEPIEDIVASIKNFKRSGARLSKAGKSKNMPDYKTPAELAYVTSFIIANFKRQAFNTTDIASIIALLIHDKKSNAGIVLFVLLEDFGVTQINKEVPNSLIKEAFDFYNKFQPTT